MIWPICAESVVENNQPTNIMSYPLTYIHTYRQTDHQIDHIISYDTKTTDSCSKLLTSALHHVAA